jgi:AraC-like DNA-binding protein
MPDGCVDIVVTFDDRSVSAHAVGAMTRPIVFQDGSPCSYLGVRFRPGVAGVLFGLPASGLTDERPSLGDVWPESGVIDRARAAADVDWSSVAFDAGYYDQSHLIAEVKELTGLPPAAWLGRRA